MDLRRLSPFTPTVRMNTMEVPWLYRGRGLETCVSMGTAAGVYGPVSPGVPHTLRRLVWESYEDEERGEMPGHGLGTKAP